MTGSTGGTGGTTSFGGVTAAGGSAGGAFEEGVRLGVWLEMEIRPQLRRWTKSQDRRVRILASVFSDQVEDAVTDGEKGDWSALTRLKDQWDRHAGAES